MNYDPKNVAALLKDVQSDANLQSTDDSTVLWDELYPQRHHVMLPNAIKNKSSLRTAMLLIGWDPILHSKHLSEEQKESMTAEKERLESSLFFTATQDNHWNEAKFLHWKHRVTNLCLDALRVGYKDTGHVTDAFKMIFKPSDTTNIDISSSENRNVKGYAFSHPILVDNPFVHPRNLHADDGPLNKLISDTQPVALAASMVRTASDEKTKAVTLITKLKSAAISTLREVHAINTHTLLVLLLDLIPNARAGTSHVFQRLKEHRNQHLISQKEIQPDARTAYNGEHVFQHLKSLYVSITSGDRHVAWTVILLHTRKPAVPIYEWLVSFGPLVRSYLQAGTEPSQRDKLSISEVKQLNMIAAKFFSDHELSKLANINSTRYGGNKAMEGEYSMDDIKLDIAANISSFDRVFRYEQRHRDFIAKRLSQHSYISKMAKEAAQPKPERKRPRDPPRKQAHSQKAVHAKRQFLTLGDSKGKRPSHPRNTGGRGGSRINSPYRNRNQSHGPNPKKGSQGGKGKPKGENPHANLKCDFCGKMGHIKRNCFKYQRLQNSKSYQSSKITQTPKVQLCLELLENATDRAVCPQCYQDYCDGYACESLPIDQSDMDTASSLFFNSTMYEECYDAKSASIFEPFSPEVYYMSRNSSGGDAYDNPNSSSSAEAVQPDVSDTQNDQDAYGEQQDAYQGEEQDDPEQYEEDSDYE